MGLRQRKGGAAPAKGAEAAADAAAEPLPTPSTVSIDTSTGHLGVTLTNPSRGPGVLVEDACELDLVAKAGVVSGSVIVSLNGKAVNEHSAAMEIIHSSSGDTLKVEFWTEAQAAEVFQLTKPAGSSGAWRAFKWIFVLSALALLPVSIVFASTGTVDMTQLPKVFSDFVAPPAPIKKDKIKATPTISEEQAAKIQSSKEAKAGVKPFPGGLNLMHDSLEETEEKLEAMSYKELVKFLKRFDPNWKPDPEKHTVEVLRDQIYGQAQRAQAEMKERDPDALAKKRKRQLKNMGAEELRDKLLDVGVDAALSMSGAKELRALAEKEDALAKWDRLPDDFKLEKSRARAEESVRKQNIKAAKERAEKKAKQDKWEEENPMGHMSDAMKPPPSWEVEEWDPVTESEMMERIARLPMYKTMTPDMLDKIIAMVRSNPKMIDMLEGEAKSNQMMGWMKEEGASIPVEDLAAMGMKMHQFDKSKPLDKVSF